MFRQSRLQSEKGLGHFRLRGSDVSRIEAFADAVFGFALTLLVVSLSIPRNTSELLANLKGVPVFAVCFLMLYFLWNCHYIYCRRFGLEDGAVRALTGALLFVVLMFVYPLKFIFSLFINGFLGFDRSALAGDMTESDVRTAFVVYGIGFAVTFWTFALLYRHAYKQRHELDLSVEETFLTYSAIVGFFATGCVGVVSMLMALTTGGIGTAFAGFIYSAMGLVAWRHGRWEAKRLQQLMKSKELSS